jgi:hypothetical protein
MLPKPEPRSEALVRYTLNASFGNYHNKRHIDKYDTSGLRVGQLGQIWAGSGG